MKPHAILNTLSLSLRRWIIMRETKERRPLKSCQDLGVSARFIPTLDLSPYDTIIMVTNTNTCLVDNQNIEDVPKGAFLASLCTTSQVGEIAPNVYAHDDFNVFFDYDLTRSFTSDMRAADKAGHLSNVTHLKEILDGTAPNNLDLHSKRNLLRLTGTPMQNIAVLNMIQERQNNGDRNTL